LSPGTSETEEEKSCKYLITRERGNMTAKDKRDRVRHADAKIVDFVVGRRSHRGSATNMSGDGVFINTKGRFSKGQAISMAFESPRFEKREKRTGKIVRITPEGIGVEFNYPGYTR
jgi:hypothetical protein